MGIINVRGAFAGAGGALEQGGMELLKNSLEEQKAARIAELMAQNARTTHRVNAQTDIELLPQKAAAETGALVDRERLLREPKLETKRGEAQIEADTRVDVAKRSPRTIAEGSTEIVDGQPGFTAPKTAVPKSPEELAEMTSRARYLDAMARAADRRTGEKPEKPIFPKLMKGDTEGTFFIDQNTNALGTVVPATPGTPREKNWIFPDKPEVKGKPASMVWSVGGATLTDREYNQRFYGNANPVSGRGSSPGDSVPSAAGIDWSPWLGSAAPAEKPTPGILNSRVEQEPLLKPEDLEKIGAAKSPAEKTRTRNMLTKQRMEERRLAQRALELPLAAGEEENYRARGIDPTAPAFRR